MGNGNGLWYSSTPQDIHLSGIWNSCTSNMLGPVIFAAWHQITMSPSLPVTADLCLSLSTWLTLKSASPADSTHPRCKCRGQAFPPWIVNALLQQWEPTWHSFSDKRRKPWHVHGCIYSGVKTGREHRGTHRKCFYQHKLFAWISPRVIKCTGRRCCSAGLMVSALRVTFWEKKSYIPIK